MTEQSLGSCFFFAPSILLSALGITFLLLLFLLLLPHVVFCGCALHLSEAADYTLNFILLKQIT